MIWEGKVSEWASDQPTELDGACVPFEIYWLRAADQELFAPAEQSAFNIHNAHEHNSSCLYSSIEVVVAGRFVERQWE